MAEARAVPGNLGRLARAHVRFHTIETRAILELGNGPERVEASPTLFCRQKIINDAAYTRGVQIHRPGCRASRSAPNSRQTVARGRVTWSSLHVISQELLHRANVPLTSGRDEWAVMDLSQL